MMDRRTDRQTDALGNTICFPTMKGGDITNKLDKYLFSKFPFAKSCTVIKYQVSWKGSISSIRKLNCFPLGRQGTIGGQKYGEY